MRILPELPLLRRELTELANRRRTYIVRVTGAVVLLFVVLIAYDWAISARQQGIGLLGGRTGSNRFLGIGGDIFTLLTPFLFLMIHLMMPALACAAITTEKENNTIGTLLLTKLSPSTVVIEKLGSRLVPMLTILFLSFPLLAHVHSLGGVDTHMLASTLWLLLCECLLVASIALLCSSWFPTTLTAFIWSYAISGTLLMLNLSLGFRTFLPSAIWYEEYLSVPRWGGPGIITTIANSTTGVLSRGTAGLVSSWITESLRQFFTTLPCLILTAAILLAARLLLVRRAFVSQSSALLRFFRSVDTFFKDLNERTTGGIEIIRDSNPLPKDDPVAWRERNKKSLGKARYLFRMLILLQGPTLFICTVAAQQGSRSGFTGLYILQGLIWSLAILIAAVKGATLFSSERAKETIEPLLAAPMTSIELLSQKVAGMRRLLIVLAIPVLTVSLTHYLLNQNSSGGSIRLLPIAYLFLSVWTATLLLYLTAWVSTGIGLRVHSPTKAILAAVAWMVAWILVPLMLAGSRNIPSPIREVLLTLSPYSLFECTERFLVGERFFGDWYQHTDETGAVWWMIALPLYTLLFLTIRFAVRSTAPRLLNRLETPLHYQSPPAPTLQIPALEGSR